jgi:hypothetical protein
MPQARRPNARTQRARQVAPPAAGGSLTSTRSSCTTSHRQMKTLPRREVLPCGRIGIIRIVLIRPQDTMSADGG